MTSRRILVLSSIAVLAAVLCTASTVALAGPQARSVSPQVAQAERLLEGLPWKPDVIRANLASVAPVALVQVYAMSQDVVAVDNLGKVYCLSRRDLSAKWVSSLRFPLAAPPAEGPLHYVCLLKDDTGAAWLQWFSKRSGAEANASPVRVPFAPSTGVAATAATAFVGSLGSARDNKTLETYNLADGSPGWGFRTLGRVVATPAVDPTGQILVVVSEDRSVTAMPADQLPQRRATVNWEDKTFGANTCAPALTKDWMFLGSDDNLLRAYDLHSGQIVWTAGMDAAVRKTPWTLGGEVAREVATGGEEGPKARVEKFEGFVFVRNALGLHAFEATTGAPVFKDDTAERPLVKQGEWVVTLDRQGNGQLRKGKGLAVQSTVGLSAFDFLPTNQRDGIVVAAFSDGTVFLAVPK